VDFNIFSWIVPSAHDQAPCAVPINGQIKYFSSSQAGTCLSDYDQLTGVVKGVIGATGTTVAALAGAFLLASTTAAGTDINQKFTAGDGSTVLVTGRGDQPFRQILVTYPDGTTANLTIETYDDGGAVRLTSGTIGTLPMTPSQLKDMGYALTNAGVPSVVMSTSSNNAPPVTGASPGKETKGRTTQWEKQGGTPEAEKDFNELNPSDVKNYPNGVKVGTLTDGSTVIVRPQSTDGRPTLEIQRGKYKTKVRYD
jgi:filamentous hemagglutinin